MTYEAKTARRPEDANTFISKSQLGWVDVEDYGRANNIYSGIPPPKKQFHGSKRLYPKESLRRCQEWVQDLPKDQ
ncbi:hypothetical protein AAL_05849 [Moelleriella libera RCEF 2490]|uniref:Uncharacterized protein n=1 Tax=Moelleriella libera RCEF 2490 TaxID=1081109 RepID=A0A167ZLG4_9HYPO|nr:hypothetical protein AAL_05849 [Moelleriella libera RCEF 2490]